MDAVRGAVDPAFAPVREALAGVLAEPGELGAAVSVVVDGRTVRTCGAATQTSSAIGRGGTTPAVACSRPARVRWRSFPTRPPPGAGSRSTAPSTRCGAVAGKNRVTVRDLLSHRAGLPAVRADLPVGSMFDWTAMVTALAAEEAWWTPGTRHGYHLTTFGWLVGEVVRRVCGVDVAGAMRTHLTGPVGSGFTYGASGGDIAECSAARPAGSSPAKPMDVLPPVSAALMRALTNPPDMLAPDLERSASWRAAVVPASNGYATARPDGRLRADVSAGAAARRGGRRSGV